MSQPRDDNTVIKKRTLRSNTSMSNKVKGAVDDSEDFDKILDEALHRRKHRKLVSPMPQEETIIKFKKEII